MPPPLPLSSRSRRTTDSPISYFIQKAIDTSGLISLAAGLVDEESLPTQEVGEAVARLMADPATGRTALQYGSNQGLTALRERVLADLCAADEVSPADLGIAVEDVLLTTGSQQLLYLVGEALIEPGDIVITEAPSYFVFHDCLKSHGARVLAVPMDAGGMNVEALDDLLGRLDRSGELDRMKLIYTVDYFQNPTGLTLAADRRPRLVETARRFSRRHRILILEDAAYRELRYDGPDLPSLKRFDPGNSFVAYTSTFSKSCAPGLKTGYAIVPRDLVAPLCNLKGNHDFGSTNLAQHVVSELMATGAYHRHVARLRTVYQSKRDALLRSLTVEFADWPEVRWTRPGGGLYVWLTFPPHIDAGPGGPLVQRALDAGVLYVPGQFGHVPDASGQVPTNEVRLSFGVADEDRLAEGVRRLRLACRGLEDVPVRRSVALPGQAT
jgi:2-aminoadipate transaminase